MPFAYTFPGSTPGHDFGDSTLESGGAGWYLSVEDIAKVLISLNQKDGKVLSNSRFEDMTSWSAAAPLTEPYSAAWSGQLGWNGVMGGGYRYLEKNGLWLSNGARVSTSIVMFGPSSQGPAFLGVLFVNSDLTREEDVGAATVLKEAFLGHVRSFP